MATRQNYFAEQRTRATTTSTSYQDFLQLTFTPDADSDYLIVWGAAVDTNSTGFFMKTRLQDVAATATLAEGFRSASSTNDRSPVGGIEKMTFGSSPGAQDLRIQFCADSGSPTIGCDEAYIWALKLGANDVYDEDETTVSPTDTFTTAATLSFTPPSSGDYLILYSGEFAATTTTSNGFIAKLDNGSELCRMIMSIIRLDPDWYCCASMVKLTGLSGAQTINLQVRNESGGASAQTNMRRARVAALRLDDFEAEQYAETRARTTYNANTSDQTMVTLSFTPAAAEHVVLHAMALDNAANNGGRKSVGRVYEDATLKSEVKFTGNDTNNRQPWLNIYRSTLAAASTEFTVKYATENTLATVGISESAIAVLQTEALGGGDALTVENEELPFAVEDVGLTNASSPLTVDSVELPFEPEDVSLENIIAPANADDVELPFDAEDVALSVPGEDLAIDSIELPFAVQNVPLRVPGQGDSGALGAILVNAQRRQARRRRRR